MSFTHAQFVSNTGELFAIDGDTVRQIRLAKVSALRPCGQQYLYFSLLFEIDMHVDLLHQGTYRLRNATLGETDLFIAPIHYTSGAPGKQYYEAVFTHQADN